MKRSSKGRSVYLDVGVWLADDDSIHMTVKGAKGFHTTVNNVPGSKRCHPNLYMKLARFWRTRERPIHLQGEAVKERLYRARNPA